MKTKSVWRSVFEVLEIVIIALILSWILRSFLVDTRVIPSGSMLPTIELGDRVVVDKIYYKRSELKRGDVVVFRPPASVKSDEDFIKRVIGLPGEKIEVKNQKVYINDQPLVEPYIIDQAQYQYGPIIIPKDAYFVMGDNRNNSDDSHVWGLLPKGNITGRTLFRYWPINRFGTLAG